MRRIMHFTGCRATIVRLPGRGASRGARVTLDLAAAATTTAPSIAAEPRSWPKSAVEQLSAITALVAQRAVTVDAATASFTGAKRELVLRHLETLALMGEVIVGADDSYAAVRKAA